MEITHAYIAKRKREIELAIQEAGQQILQLKGALQLCTLLEARLDEPEPTPSPEDDSKLLDTQPPDSLP